MCLKGFFFKATFFFLIFEMTLRALKLHQFSTSGFEGEAGAEESSENRK